MIIRELKLRDYPYKSRRGLAEKLVKRYYQKKGYAVFRGMRLLDQKTLFYYFYPSVRKRHDALQKILKDKLAERKSEFTLSLGTGRGIPDYIMHMNKKGNSQTFFVEVKLEHESVKKNQIACMRLLESCGFTVTIVRLKQKVINEKMDINMQSMQKRHLVKQQRLRLKYPRKTSQPGSRLLSD